MIHDLTNPRLAGIGKAYLFRLWLPVLACPDLVPAGLPLGSKTVTALAYQAGNCLPSGGEPSGTVEAAFASTFCCLMG